MNNNDFRGTKIIADSTKASASSAIVSKSPLRFRRANAGIVSEQQCDVHMQLDH